MNNKKLLSIIIPVYNREKMITKALDSIPNLNSIEVIVVDDCSTDNTYKILKEYKKIDLLIFKTKSNLGPGAARNIGIDEATGDYITFLDSDDWFIKDNLLKAIELLDGINDIIWFNNKTQKNGSWKGSSQKLVFQGSIIKKSLIGNTRYETSFWGEERLFVDEIKLKAKKQVDVNYGIYVYNYRPGSIVNKEDTLTYKYLSKNNFKWHKIANNNTIRVWWYTPPKNDPISKGKNAGDYFGKWLLEQIGYKCFYSEEAPDIITCGSILATKSWKGHPYIWGSGFHNETDTPKYTDNIYAVRGRLTYNKLNNQNKDIALGDPGLLASYFYKPTTSKKYKFGIVPHYVDFDELKKYYKDLNVPIIDMRTENIEELLNKINECEFIFSSSLHGIIFSHSLGIPAIHIENKELFSKNNFKFKDYYSVFKSIKYTKDFAKSVNFNDYLNSDLNLYKPNETELENIQKSLLDKFPLYKPSIAICAVAKCENEYINDWVKYHIDLGVDDIYLYDNNDSDYEPIEKRIDKKYLEHVHITKVPNAKEFQIPTYNKFYNENKNKYSWIGFLDIDEFIVLNKWKNIKEFLNDEKFKYYNVIKLNWHMFGDDDKISRDMTVPIYKGITKRLKGHEYESHGKQFIRGNQDGVNICSNHYCTINGKIPMQIMPDGKSTSAKISGHHNCEEAYINHYMTKTLSEFIDQKLARGTDASFKNRKINFDYFWRINTKTTDKLNFIEKNIFIEKNNFIENNNISTGKTVVNTCIGIISYLPDDKAVRNIRINRLNNLIETLNDVFNLPIIIIAQNWKNSEIILENVDIIKYYDKLGITKARETLRQVFCKETKYSNIICLDDDFELSDNPKFAKVYLRVIENNKDKLIIYENFLMNLAVFPRKIFEQNPFDLNIDPEKGTGYEDWIYISNLQEKYDYRKIKDYGLSKKKRSELVNDEYSTWITKNTNKSKIDDASRQIIYGSVKLPKAIKR